MGRLRNGWHALVESLLPWYDRTAERQRAERSAAILAAGEKAVSRVERTRQAYEQMGDRLGRRR